MVKILIPADTGNEEIKVVRFQHNGINVYVPLGEVTKVPNWVVELNPNYEGMKVVERLDEEDSPKKKR